MALDMVPDLDFSSIALFAFGRACSFSRLVTTTHLEPAYDEHNAARHPPRTHGSPELMHLRQCRPNLRYPLFLLVGVIFQSSGWPEASQGCYSPGKLILGVADTCTIRVLTAYFPAVAAFSF